LLTHSAGVTVHGFGGYAAGTPVPTIVQVLNGEAPANSNAIRVDVLPGSMWRYSGGGYTIAQLAAADVSGISFPKLMQDTVLRPFGMEHSTFEQPLPPQLLAQAATPYRGNGTPVKGGPHVYPELAAAGLWTTPSDLARFAIGIQEALSGKSQSVLSTKTVRDMLQPAIEQQGIGFAVDSTLGTFSHGGANEGYRCSFIAFQDGNGVIIMTNSDSGGALLPELTRTIAYEQGWPGLAPVERVLNAVAPGSFDRYSGAYRQEDGTVLTFWRDGGQVRARIWGEPVLDLFPTSETEYFAKTIDIRVAFSGSGGSADVAGFVYQNRGQRPQKRLAEADAKTALAWSQAMEKRISEQTATPGAEAALRALIAGVASGKPDYGRLSEGLGRITRQQLSSLQATVQGFGMLETVSFRRVAPNGADIFDVKFANGTYEFRILLLPDGRVDRAGFAPSFRSG
jgi:hypothetical protein